LAAEGPARPPGRELDHVGLDHGPTRPGLGPVPAAPFGEAHAEPANKRMDLPGLGRTVCLGVGSAPLALQVMRGR